MTSADPEVATTTFTYLALESELKKLRDEMRNARDDNGVPEPIRDWNLAVLMELHNRLDVESVRQQERHLQLLLNSLQLEGIGGKLAILGGLKARVTEANSDAFNHVTPSGSDTTPITCGFVDPLYGSGSSPMGSTSGILLAQKKEVTQKLILLNRKPKLTPEEEREKKELIAELRKINGTE